METGNNKKQFYFNGIDADLLVHTDDSVNKINISEIIDSYNCTLEREFTIDQSKIKKYKLNSDIFIDSLDSNGSLSVSKITHILHKEGCSGNKIYNIEYNSDKCLISNLAIYDKKKGKIIISPINNIEQKFIIQNVGRFAYDTLIKHNHIELNIKTGFLVGYWLLRGGFNRLEKDDCEFLYFKGKENDLELLNSILHQIFPNSTVFKKKSYKDFELLILVNNDFQNFIVEKFGNKKIPNWILRTHEDFIKGILFSFIYCRCYISKDKNDNSYLVISNKNKELLENLNFILKNKFSIYSKFISNNYNSLSFKINKKLYEILTVGIEEKLFSIDDINDINLSEYKEFFIKDTSFKIIPWYKLKITQDEKVENSFTLKLDNNKIFMLHNGLFVLS